MTTKRPTAADPARDADAARAATDNYFASEAAAASAADRPGIEQRRQAVAAGDRLTRSEARLVLLSATDEPVRIGRDLIHGSAESNHAAFREARDFVDAARRGLTADGYDVATFGAGGAR